MAGERFGVEQPFDDETLGSDRSLDVEGHNRERREGFHSGSVGVRGEEGVGAAGPVRLPSHVAHAWRGGGA